MKKKATGNDDVPGRYTQSVVTDGLRIMTQLINSVCETGQWSKEFTEVSVIALKKKPKATKCSNHCTISLTAHTAQSEE